MKSVNQALLVIDVQKGIDDGEYWGGNRNNPEAEGNIKLLIETWRLRNLPVVMIRHRSVSPTSPLRPGQIGFEFKSFIQPLDGEMVVEKSTANAFIKTPLQARLDERSVNRVVIAGFVTNNSVEATARMAGELGYDTIVVADATACFDKQGMDGIRYASSVVHDLSLANLKGEYATIMTTKEIIDNL